MSNRYRKNNQPPGNHDDYSIGDAKDKNSFTFTANFDCKPESNAHTTCQTPHGIVYGLYVKDHYFMISNGETYSGSKVIDFSGLAHPITVALRPHGVLVKYFLHPATYTNIFGSYLKSGQNATRQAISAHGNRCSTTPVMNYSDGVSVNYRVIILLNQSWVSCRRTN